MNKLRNNIILSRQGSKSNTKSSSNGSSGLSVVNPLKQKELSASTTGAQQAKKKRSALGNISNATNATKDEAVKKSRFGNQVFSFGSKKETIKIDQTKSLSSKENLIVQQTKTKKISTSVSSTSKISVLNSDSENRHLILNCEKLELNEKIDINDLNDEVFEPIDAKDSQLRACDVKGWEDIDAEDTKDEFNVADYVAFVFEYYRKREDTFLIGDYLVTQKHLNKQMRHLLIDWMVEVQQQLEFNHEVLYLSVKLLDLYLNSKIVEKEKLQLLGGAAMFIACKYEERIPPVIDDFIYVSDNAYDRSELIRMEIDILKTVRYDLGIPLSYTFLRRYAKCVHADMRFLTLARYILELALQEYAFAYVKDSIKACASLYLALKLSLKEQQSKSQNGGESTASTTVSQLSATEWNETLIHYTDAFVKDFIEYVPIMNTLVKNAPLAKYKTIFRKYSHPVFYEVATIQPLTDAELDSLIASDK